MLVGELLTNVAGSLQSDYVRFDWPLAWAGKLIAYLDCRPGTPSKAQPSSLCPLLAKSGHKVNGGLNTPSGLSANAPEEFSSAATGAMGRGAAQVLFSAAMM